MKRYKYRAKDYKNKVKKYWKELEELEDMFYQQLEILENKISKEIRIKDIEFFWCDNNIVGIGNISKTMELIQRY